MTEYKEAVERISGAVSGQAALIAQLKGAINENVTKTANSVSEQSTVIQQLKSAIGENVSKTSNEVSEQASLIAEIKTALEGKAAGGGVAEPVIEPLEITENGTYTAPDGINGYSPVVVTVPIPDGYIQPSGTLEITENGDHDVTEYASVNVAVPTGGGSDTRLKDLAEGTLTELYDDTITQTRSDAFYGASSLEKVSLPNLTNVGSYTFFDCISLVEADLPSLSGAVATYAFSGCEALKQVNIPQSTGLNNYSFQNTYSLEKLELGVPTSIGSYAFRNGGIKALIIRNNTRKLTKLNSTNAFTNTPIVNDEGYI